MTHYDLYGIGNALVDMEFSVDDSFLRDNAVTKGHMTLVDEGQMEALLDRLSERTPTRASGGSAATSSTRNPSATRIELKEAAGLLGLGS